MRLLALFLVALVGCGDGDARPVQIQLLNRGSCSPPQYDLTCMRAIRVQMFSEEQSYRAKCTQVAPAFATWQELVSSRKTDFLLEEIRARKDVRIEIRGYQHSGRLPAQMRLSVHGRHGVSGGARARCLRPSGATRVSQLCLRYR